MSIATQNLLIFLIVGALAGWLAGALTRGHGFGILGNMLIGVIGAIIGGWVFGLLGVTAFGILGVLLTAFIGAFLLLSAARVLRAA